MELFDQKSSLSDKDHVPSMDDLDARYFTTPNGPCDLVQDVTTDCSVVAGLSAAINVLTGKHQASLGMMILWCIVLMFTGAFFYLSPI